MADTIHTIKGLGLVGNHEAIVKRLPKFKRVLLQIYEPGDRTTANIDMSMTTAVCRKLAYCLMKCANEIDQEVFNG